MFEGMTFPSRYRAFRLELRAGSVRRLWQEELLSCNGYVMVVVAVRYASNHNSATTRL